MTQEAVFPGADESTPSRAQYFSWINNTNEGATEAQTFTNLAFFEWLHREYGMVLDIYAFDAGAIDGARFYGSLDSDRFHRQFPNGFGPVVEAARRMGCRLGVWGGPDGFGDTPEERRARIETMVSLCRDHHFMLFKFDAVCGQLRPEKYDAFVEMMTACRKHAPDLILLNHRLELGPGMAQGTTTLLGGAETYIDVHMRNREPAPHNRGGALSRATPEGLPRLTEDHGVCLSSCLDYWEDDLVLQAFCRCMILAPEIYGNPWLLADHEFPRLARIYNLHRRYRDILVNGLELPESTYGPHAVSRGDGTTRFLVLRNLGWEPTTVAIGLDATIGLEQAESFEVRRLHPFERSLGRHAWGTKVSVEVLPYRACLVMVSAEASCPEIGFHGCDGEIIRDCDGRPLELKLWGAPGSTAKVAISPGRFAPREALLDGQPAPGLLASGGREVTFDGPPLKQAWHRKLANLESCAVPEDAQSLLEATFFAADSNALEVRERERSGPTAHEPVRHARAAFFGQAAFRQRGLHDRNLFDDDPDTFFACTRRFGDPRVGRGAFRLDFGEPVRLDQLVLEAGHEYFLQPLKAQEAVHAVGSADLKTWVPIPGFADPNIRFTCDAQQPIRYFRLPACPDRVNEVRGYRGGKPLPRAAWRASNLLPNPWPPRSAFKATVVLEEYVPGSYLAVPIYAEHGAETVYAAARTPDGYLGAPRRAPSYPCNSFECPVRAGSGNYTYFIPLEPGLVGKPIEVYVLGHATANLEGARCETWLTAYPIPYVGRSVTLR